MQKLLPTQLEEQHTFLLHRILREKLYQKLKVFQKHNPVLERAWIEPFFTNTGIFLYNTGYYTISCPDLLLFTRNPNYLLVVEAKMQFNMDSYIKMQQQLRISEEYIEKHGEDLYNFLISQNIRDSDIQDTRIGFSGLVRTRHGRNIREVIYYEMYNSE